MRRYGGSGETIGSWVFGLVVFLATGVQAISDTIELRGGGEIQGKVITDPSKPDTVQVLLLNGRNPLVFQSKQILRVTPKSSPLDEYLVRKHQLSATAPAEFELGLWCERNGLADLARAHYQAAIVHDKMFEPARKKLGHVQHGNQWLSPDELRQVQGLVKYKGRWVTEEARAKSEESAQLSAAQTTWVRRIKMLRQAMVAGTEERRREAEAELMQIREVEAVHPLVKVLANDSAPSRTLLAHALGAIPGKESNRALVDMLLAEPEDDLRTGILDRIREKDEPATIPQLVKALRSENVKVVNRAAWALGNLEVVNSVPALVAALLTTEERMVIGPTEAEGQATNSAANVGPGPALMAMNQNWLAYLTPPAMAPGVVAYGAVSVPFVSQDQLTGGILGALPPSGRGPVPRLVTYTYQNVEVLGALIKLTGQDFGYDGSAWRRWISRSFNPNPKAVRQIPQP
jgi:HEAT repeats